MDRFRSDRAMLNDACINSGAALLQELWSRPGDVSEQSSRRCAVFSTFDLLMARYHVLTRDIYRRTKNLEYWNKDIWVLPIHWCSSQHWVLCILQIKTYEILLFDSLASRSPWKHEIHVSCSSAPIYMFLLTYFTGDHGARQRTGPCRKLERTSPACCH